LGDDLVLVSQVVEEDEINIVKIRGGRYFCASPGPAANSTIRNLRSAILKCQPFPSARAASACRAARDPLL
jgi:hypothetical protein